ncbi:hypothetical protein QJQ45_005949 [Haematococcus lacustris]|nr:hypothetical protein QJQ45_005949 [Haematococcus lacustris]
MMLRHSVRDVRLARDVRRSVVTPSRPAPAAPSAPNPGDGDRSHDTDVVVVGSGIGGLTAAALLAHHGYRVSVVESHSVAGGACHTFTRQGYHFESGPSLYSGMGGRGKEANPVGHVLQVLGEPLDLITYNTWNVFLPEGQFLTQVGSDNFSRLLAKLRGPEAVGEWAALQVEVMRPLARASTMLPPAALRGDAGVLITGLARYLPSLVTGGGGAAARLTGPFSKVVEGVVRDPFILNWLNLLCFLLSGLPANGTIAAEVAFM